MAMRKRLTKFKSKRLFKKSFLKGAKRRKRHSNMRIVPRGGYRL